MTAKEEIKILGKIISEFDKMPREAQLRVLANLQEYYGRTNAEKQADKA